MKRCLNLRKLNKAFLVFMRCRIRRYRTRRYTARAATVLIMLMAVGTFVLSIGENSMDMAIMPAKPVIASEAEPDSVITPVDNGNADQKAVSEAEQKKYATSHKEKSPEEDTAQNIDDEENIREPLTASPVTLSDIYAESGSIAAFKCFYPGAEAYTWETYDENSGWIPAPADNITVNTDELYRQISTFMVLAPDKEQKELVVRCNVKRTAGAPITEEAALHVLPKIETVSADSYTAEAGTYISAREIPVQVSFADGSQDTVTGLGGLYFLEKEESTEQDTTVSGNMKEIITTVITAHDYMYLEGEKDVVLRYQGKNESVDVPVRLIGKDSTPPDITQLTIDDFEISTVDQPVAVHVAISAKDDVTAHSNLQYAFLHEGEEPQEETWTNQSSFDVDITMNGKWIAYCRDESGNIAKKERDIIAVDNKAPVVKLSLENETWCTENKILVDARDGLSVEYCYSCAQTGEDSGWITKNEYVVSQNGTWNVRARDAAGNMTEEEITIENIDNQAPVIKGITEKKEIEEENDNR